MSHPQHASASSSASGLVKGYKPYVKKILWFGREEGGVELINLRDGFKYCNNLKQNFRKGSVFLIVKQFSITQD